MYQKCNSLETNHAWEAQTERAGLGGWDAMWRERETKEHWGTKHISKEDILKVVPPALAIPTDHK